MNTAFRLHHSVRSTSAAPPTGYGTRCDYPPTTTAVSARLSFEALDSPQV